MSYVEIPSLIIGNRFAMPNGRSCFAFVPGAVNFQPAAGKVFMARLFTCAVGGSDLFETEILRQIPNAEFVRSWDIYHNRMGEVHCGTNAKRVIPMDWFRRIPKAAP